MPILSLKKIILTSMAWGYYYSGMFFVHLWWRRQQKRAGLILMFHRVQPRASEVFENHLGLPSLIISVENFRELLDFVKKHFHCTSLSAFSQSSINGEKMTNSLCALTFDDGYRDFLQYAWPALHRRDLPVTVFLPTAMIGTPARFWWDELYHACMTSESFAADSFVEPMNVLVKRLLNLPKDKRSTLVYQVIDAVQGWPQEDLQRLIKALAAKQNGNCAASENALLDWEEIRELHRDGVQFGSHTRRHCNLKTLSSEEAKQEIETSKHELEDILHEPVATFAFPGGHITDETVRLLAASGYTLACSTRLGLNRLGEDLFRLRRVNMWDGVMQDFRGKFSKAVFAFNLMRAR